MTARSGSAGPRSAAARRCAGRSPSRLAAIAALVLALAVTACASQDTRVHLSVSGESPDMDNYEIQVGTKSALAAPQTTLDMIVPDEIAGMPVAVQLWGLSGGTQIAYGTTTVTPDLHGTVDGTVALMPVSCTGTFCTAGSVECSGDGTITCSAGSDGCLSWSAVTPCPTGTPECSNGVCGTICTDECSTGEPRCDSAGTMQTCGQFDSDSCLDWGPSTACSAGQVCTGSACMAGSGSGGCGSDGASCDDGNACTTGDTCASGVCSGSAVACDNPPVQPVCFGGILVGYIGTCGSDGTCAYTEGETPCASPTNGTGVCNAAANGCTFTCNSGYMVSGSSCVPTAPVTGKIVFITSKEFSGALGGLAGADTICQNDAIAAHLTGTYMAWLSDSKTSAASRMTHSTMPYVLINGVEVAASWTGLTSGTLMHGIDMSELGGTFDNFTVWTNTSSTGAGIDGSVNSCTDWTVAATTVDPWIGNAGSIDATWTKSAHTAFTCADTSQLYCIEQ